MRLTELNGTSPLLLPGNEGTLLSPAFIDYCVYYYFEKHHQHFSCSSAGHFYCLDFGNSEIPHSNGIGVKHRVMRLEWKPDSQLSKWRKKRHLNDALGIHTAVAFLPAHPLAEDAKQRGGGYGDDFPELGDKNRSQCKQSEFLGNQSASHQGR